jgi:hypothetical protein
VVTAAVLSSGLALVAAGLAPASAQTAQSSLVATVPSTATPAVSNGIVYALAQVGNRVLAGGTFTRASSAGSSTVLARPYVLSFDPTNGALDPAFAPTLDGEVQALQPGPTPGTVYVLGNFKTVNHVADRGIALLSTTTGKAVPGFVPPKVDGEVWDAQLVRGHLVVAGTFAHAGGLAHSGVMSLNPTTGALDPWVQVQLTGHHNYTGGTGANGAVGAHRVAVSPDGTLAVLIGNFKQANGVTHDQVVELTLTAGSADVNTGWNTGQFTAACLSGAYDSYVRDVDFAPNGSYFVIAATGGSGTNTDGSNSLCDSASRWETASLGFGVRPTWVDYTGQDTLLSVAVTGTAVYVGGHQRWLNNSLARDTAGPGSVPRPGLAALDPVSGIPLTWNPGRNPRGIGTYALLATSTGLYAGYDTTFIGNKKYARWRVAYFPLAGGEVLPSSATGVLPGKVYFAGVRSAAGTFTDTLTSRTFNGASASGATAVPDPSGTAWSSVRGTVQVGSRLYYGWQDGNLYERTFDGTTLGPAALVDPYDDPAWDNVQTGSGQTYRGKPPGLYGTEMTKVTGAVFTGGRLYYSVAGQQRLRSRWFSPESGIVGSDEVTAGGTVDFSGAGGMFLSGATLYWVSSVDGSLHAVPFAAGSPSAAGDHVVSGPAKDGVDWRARGLFLVP